jgi:hypothetical protein
MSAAAAMSEVWQALPYRIKWQGLQSAPNMHYAADFAGVVPCSFAMETAAAIPGGQQHSQKHSIAFIECRRIQRTLILRINACRRQCLGGCVPPLSTS